MADIIVSKCVRPECNTYERGLDGKRPCSDCLARGVGQPTATLRPPVQTVRAVPMRPVTLQDIIAAFRGVTPEEIERAAKKGEQYARAARQVVRTVDHVRRILR